jgi:hypothetical protein
MAWCELCDLDRSFCVHGLTDARDVAQRTATLLVSPRGMAHFEGCPHKGDDPDFSLWGQLTLGDAWQRLGNGEHFDVTDGQAHTLSALARCSDCVEHGPW